MRTSTLKGYTLVHKSSSHYNLLSMLVMIRMMQDHYGLTHPQGERAGGMVPSEMLEPDSPA